MAVFSGSGWGPVVLAVFKTVCGGAYSVPGWVRLPRAPAKTAKKALKWGLLAFWRSEMGTLDALEPQNGHFRRLQPPFSWSVLCSFSLRDCYRLAANWLQFPTLDHRDSA